jgi:predicted nucleotidyltransferase
VIDKKKTYELLKQYFHNKPVEKVVVIGSFARNEQTENSDIDIIITPKEPLGLFRLAQIRLELCDLLHLNVDLTTHKGISPYVLPFIKNEMEVVYEQ